MSSVTQTAMCLTLQQISLFSTLTLVKKGEKEKQMAEEGENRRKQRKVSRPSCWLHSDSSPGSLDITCVVVDLPTSRVSPGVDLLLSKCLAIYFFL